MSITGVKNKHAGFEHQSLSEKGVEVDSVSLPDGKKEQHPDCKHKAGDNEFSFRCLTSVQEQLDSGCRAELKQLNQPGS
jgi:hypothetical protein